MTNVVRWWRWLAAAIVVGAVIVLIGPRMESARRTQQAARGEAVPGQLVVEDASDLPFSFDDEQYDAYVASVRALADGVTDEDDRLDRDDLIVMGRRVCFHLTRSAITSTRDYVRTYRNQRRDIGYPVFKRLLVQGAAVAETAPSTFCPEHVGAVSASEAAKIVGFDEEVGGQSVP
jgi:hypothetical protein